MNCTWILLVVSVILLGALIFVIVSWILSNRKENFARIGLSSGQMQQFISGMPKTALHMHIEGSLEPPMAFQLAKKWKMLPLKIPKPSGGFYTINTLKQLKDVYNFTDLESFLNVYNTLAKTLNSKEDFALLAKAYAVKAISENIRHAEIFFDPQTHTARGLAFEDVVDGLNMGLDYGRKQGLNIQILCSFLRDHPVGTPMDPASITSKNGSNSKPSKPTAWTTVKQAVMYNEKTQLPGGTPGGKSSSWKLVGVALDNNEIGWPPSLFKDVYAFAWKNGMYGTAHGGEEGPPKYIWECIDLLNVIRVDHAVRSIEDPELVSYLATPQSKPQLLKAYGSPHKIATTVCPLSNWKLMVFKDPTKTNIIEMMDMGILTTVNSDDPAYFGGYITENYMFLLKYLNPKIAKGRPINLADVYRLCINGFMASVLPQSKKLQYIREVNSYFFQTPGLLYDRFTKKYL